MGVSWCCNFDGPPIILKELVYLNKHLWKFRLEIYNLSVSTVHILRLRCANQIICFSQRVPHPLHSLVLSITLAESSQLMQDSSTCSTWFYSVRYNCVLCCEVSSIKTGGIKAQGPFSNRKVHNFNEKSPHNWPYWKHHRKNSWKQSKNKKTPSVLFKLNLCNEMLEPNVVWRIFLTQNQICFEQISHR